jgi:RNA recognition motif-containing protein
MLDQTFRKMDGWVIEMGIVRLFVTNLPYVTNDVELCELFQRAGEVKDAFVITDQYTGKSRGFGFVDMANEKDAAAAIEQLNDFEVRKRRLRVSIAKKQPPCAS